MCGRIAVVVDVVDRILNNFVCFLGDGLDGGVVPSGVGEVFGIGWRRNGRRTGGVERKYTLTATLNRKIQYIRRDGWGFATVRVPREYDMMELFCKCPLSEKYAKDE